MSTFTVIKTADKSIRQIIEKQIKENGGYCPCALEHNPNTICMCKDFRDKLNDSLFQGSCHCGLYIKIIPNE